MRDGGSSDFGETNKLICGYYHKNNFLIKHYISTNIFQIEISDGNVRRSVIGGYPPIAFLLAHALANTFLRRVLLRMAGNHKLPRRDFRRKGNKTSHSLIYFL